MAGFVRVRFGYIEDGNYREHFEINGMIEGQYKVYRNWELVMVSNYINDKIYGLEISEFKNIKEIKNYVNNVINGEVRYYRQPDKLMSIANYKNGKLNGYFVEYNTNETLRKKGNYIDGVLNGPYENYDIYGKITFKCNYVDGKYDGELIQYKKGRRVSTTIYTNGNI